VLSIPYYRIYKNTNFVFFQNTLKFWNLLLSFFGQRQNFDVILDVSFSHLFGSKDRFK
jgi:hypothetical protein